MSDTVRVIINTPIGDIEVEGTPERLIKVRLPRDREDYRDLPIVHNLTPYPALRQAVAFLNDYFAGKRKRWNGDQRVEGSTWAKRVYQELLKVPFGSTVSYGELARRAGKPKAARAVGMIMARNQLPILIPCHRVIGSDGGLGGFGGGLDIKRALLQHEGVPVK